jgi:glycerol-3-phosphate acyltransferase PlsX
VVLDLGANPECKPEWLLQFAYMGAVYAAKMRQASQPRVGLLSNGEEAGKGNELVKATFPLLENSGLNFIGNVESKEIYGGLVDVVVTDGFSGNIFLKTTEAVAKLVSDMLRHELLESTRTKTGAWLAKPAFDRLKRRMDPGEIGAAPLLGIDGLVFKAHGRSDGRALFNAIRTARQAVETQLLVALHEAVDERLGNVDLQEVA